MTDNIVNPKGEMEEDENDDWDDSLLVKAYDKAINLAKEKIAAKLELEKEGGETEEIGTSGEESLEWPRLMLGCSAGHTYICKIGASENQNESKAKPVNPNRKWKVGYSCRAAYSSDGCEYEAVIKSIDYQRGTCFVKYLGYGNEEEVEIESLKPTQGKEVQYAQKLQAKQTGEAGTAARNYGRHYHYSGSTNTFPQGSGVIPPPPPPFVMANLPKDETDALSAMLMSWYMSGYHTGYYQGLTKSKHQEHPPHFANGH